MAYFLRKEKKKKGTYLQMYESFWDKDKKQPRTKNVKSFGYVEDLISGEIPDPVKFYSDYVKEQNENRTKILSEESRPRAFSTPVELNIGHFLLYSLIDELDVKETIDILASQMRFQFSVFDLITQLIYARVISPCSKSKTASHVFPYIYGSSTISEDQVYDGCSFIGESYKKYIDLFNHSYEKYFKRDLSNVFFDCTNYYFEIDIPSDDKQKGPSKENRHSPIIGQALLLDADLVPVSMQMYPGNESEKPYIRKVIEEMKQRHSVSENKCVLLENDTNVFSNYTDERGNISFRLKSCIDSFDYSFKEINPETGKESVTRFSVKEKRIVSYNPNLAKKQRLEIMKMVDKASKFSTYKNIAKDELGDCAKYVDIITKDSSGKTIKPIIGLNKSKIDEDLKYAGYNLLVTSEVDMEPLQVYKTYHSLWKIEESFRLTKSYLDARPVYLQKKETIYGHFLICYLSLFLLRVLEIKCFKNKINSYDLINFMRDFRVVNKGDNTYINISRDRVVNEKVKKPVGFSNLDALYLTKAEVDNFFQNCMLLDTWSTGF